MQDSVWRQTAYAIKLLRSPTGERIKFSSPSGSTRNTKRIPGGSFAHETPLRLPGEGPAGGLLFCGAAQKMRLVRAVILSYSAAHRPQRCELWNFLKQRKKVLKFFFSEPLLYSSGTAYAPPPPPPPLRYKAFEVSYRRTNKILFSLR